VYSFWLHFIDILGCFQSLLRVPLVGIFATFAFAKSQQPNQMDYCHSKPQPKAGFA
jgi:hypothetical protein